MRPGELGMLCRRDVRLPCDAQGLAIDVAVVGILQPKTRRQAARHQSVVLRRPWAVDALSRLLYRIPSDCSLCPRGVQGLRRRFRQLLIALLLSGDEYSPASLRPGGALSFHLRHDDLGRLLYHGRWDSVKTVQHYLHEGLAASVAACLPKRASALIMQLDLLLPQILEELPQLPGRGHAELEGVCLPTGAQPWKAAERGWCMR